MTYLGINAARFGWLLRSGLSSKELERFFKEKKTPLMLKREKVQYLPRDFESALKAVVRFSEPAHHVLGEWLRHETLKGLEPYEGQPEKYFRAIETFDLRLEEGELRKLARCGLLDLYSKSPSPAWLEFLRSDPEPSEEIDASTREDEPLAAETNSLSPSAAQSYAKWALGVGTAADISDPALSYAARLADAARSGVRESVAGIADEAWQQVAEARRELRPLQAEPVASGFISLPPPLMARDATTDYLSLDAVCIPSRHSVRSAVLGGTAPFFLDVLCFHGANGPFCLSEADLRAVIPTEGRIILHPKIGLSAPRQGEPDAYRVAPLPTARAIKVEVLARGQEVYSVLSVPHTSAEKNGVREWLRERIPQLQGRAALFVLVDGLILRAGSNLVSTITLPTCDWTFDSWRTLKGVRLGQSDFYLDVLPDPDARYECGPISAVARRFLKSLLERKAAKLTRQQLTDLSVLLGDADVALTEEHRRRLADGLATLAATDVYYDELLVAVMKSKAISVDVERQKEALVSQVDEELLRKRQAVDHVQKDILAQEERLSKLKEQNEERTRDIRGAIKRAFEQARSHEAPLLGQLALWRELLAPGENAPPSAKEVAVESSPKTVPISRWPPVKARIIDIFLSAGLSKDRADVYSLSVEIAHALNVPMVISGVGSSHLGSRVAAAVAEKGVCLVEIGIGLIEANALQPALAGTESDVLLIKGANLSDISIYGAELLEAISARVCAPPTSTERLFTLLIGASGPAALPWPLEIAQLSFKLNLDGPDAAKGVDEETWLRGLVSPLQRKLWKRVEDQATGRTDSVVVLDLLRHTFWVGSSVPDT